MDRDSIRQRLTANKPLAIRTSDGKEFIVPHPEFVLAGRHNIVIEDDKGLLDIIVFNFLRMHLDETARIGAVGLTPVPEPRQPCLGACENGGTS